MVERSFEEQVLDKLLLIYLIEKANKYINGMTKLQKIVFTSEWTMVNKKIKAFNYDIFKYKQGPYSFQLEEDIKYLEKNNLIEIEKVITVTDRGKEILLRLKDNIKRNRNVVRIIDSIVETLSRKNLDDILKMVYGAEFKLPDGRIMKINDIPIETLMIKKLKEGEAKEKFTIPEEWVETVDIMMSKDFYNSLKEACKMPANIPF